ncbi:MULTISPECIES: helix-turn-helix transcriptional regulator [Rhizobium]|uniref:Helix-turn-helix transcriptional regulator n=1 Tax=Rhizobium phaseoli TaxID=396 RepID=A0A7T0EG22_9HYPH|nr:MULTISPECIES: helix-turn-helix transcriptional regulator [Rhizobium]MDE8762006.1 helix-turn-helix transcriptional regulator [Rhizobium sp. CBK13]NKF13559.1 helix-turn-helix transcriptional regulator [Rhizobium phaseoli]QPK10970.1 helix-turn-helix transcriptional regulator [Rhizobium phaseoli]
MNHGVWFNGVGIMLKQGVATDLDFVTPDILRNDPYSQEWLRPFGLKWFAGVHVGDGLEKWAPSIQRSEEQGPFTSEDVDQLRLLSRGVSSAAAVGSALGFARAEAALEAFEISNKAVVILNRSGEAVLLNRAAERLLCDDLQIRNGHLTCRDTVARRTLGAAIHAVCKSAPGSELLHPIRITRQNGNAIVAFVTPARGVALDVFSPCQAFVILIDPMERRIPSPEVLQKLFPLTPTEARLAYRLATGHKLHDLAATCGFSYETGRNHLKSIFAKLGVNSQSDLVAALVSIATPLGIF